MGLFFGAGYITAEDQVALAGDRVAVAEGGQEGFLPFGEHLFPGFVVDSQLGGDQAGHDTRAGFVALIREGCIVGGYDIIRQVADGGALDDLSDREDPPPGG